jgi:hypothetical protein
MGNTNSVPNSNIINNANKNTPKMEVDQNSVFEKILLISNEMISKYQNNFLDPNFCDSIAFIYQNKLNELDIKVLRSIYNNLNNNGNTKGKNTANNNSNNNIANTKKELRLLLQYNPKQDETFFTDSFKDKLQEVFWGKNIEYSKDIFNDQDLPANFDKFLSYIKYKPRYINPKHVNKLLESVSTQQGGNSPSNFSAALNQKLQEMNAKKNANSKKKNITTNNNFTANNNFTGNITHSPSLQNFIENNGIPKNKENNINSTNVNSKNGNTTNVNSTKVNSKNVNSTNVNSNKVTESNTLPTNNKTIQNQVNKSNNVNKGNKNKMENNENNMNKTNKNSNRQQMPQAPSQKNNLNQSEENTSKMRPPFQKNMSRPQSPPFPSSKPPGPILNKFNKSTLEKTTNKIILKYFVPGWYKTTSDFCENKENCTLTKKQLCKAITENFIVRNNIIAAILTAIPQKMTYPDGRVEYEGGICYEKFINLNECKMCVPFNYKELIGKDIPEIIQSIIQKSEYLSETVCREKGGYFLKLTDKEKKIFGSKLQYDNMNKKIYPKSKYNAFYVECLEKLKTSYFTSLNNLVQILEKMNVNAYIDNDTMNKIAKKTKDILDNMYSLCNYYYVYAIIALINGDFSVPANNTTQNLTNSFTSALKVPK